MTVKKYCVIKYIQSADILGRVRADYACLEIDEAYTPIVFKQIKPDIMVITNLFRDQLDRYGEIDSTVNIIKRAIAEADGVKLVLNPDDTLCVHLGHIRISYGRFVAYNSHARFLALLFVPHSIDTRCARLCKDEQHGCDTESNSIRIPGTLATNGSLFHDSDTLLQNQIPTNTLAKI